MQWDDRGRRRRTRNQMRWTPIIWFLIFAFFASQIFHSVPMMFWVGIFFIWGMVRMSRSQSGSRSEPYQDDETLEPQYVEREVGPNFNSAQRAVMRQVSERALQRAGRIPDESPLGLEDIGVLAYENTAQPKIFRTADIATTSSHIRPFMVINQPNIPNLSGQGVIQFNLIDGQGKLRYSNRSRYTLKAGQNFITPPTWLPLEQQETLDFGGDWTMQVVIGESTVFAVHQFGWIKVGGEARAQFTGDGEIDEVARFHMYQQPAAEPMSLDELLADQSEAAPLQMNARK